MMAQSLVVMSVKLEPQQNAVIEFYERTVRYGLLNQYLFWSLEDIQDCTTLSLWFYNHEAPIEPMTNGIGSFIYAISAL